MTFRPFPTHPGATVTTALLMFGFVAVASAQPPGEKQFRIRTRTEAFVKAQTPAANPDDDDLKKLRKARLGFALKEMYNRTFDFNRDETQVDQLLSASLRLLDAELDYYENVEERVSALRKHLEISRELTSIVESRSDAELASQSHVEFARFVRSSIELAILKAHRPTGH